jgi:hypothetical protein
MTDLLTQTHPGKVPVDKQHARGALLGMLLHGRKHLVLVLESTNDVAVMARMREVVRAAHKEHRSWRLLSEGENVI